MISNVVPTPKKNPEANNRIESKFKSKSIYFFIQRIFLTTKNKLKQKAKQDVVGKIVRDLIAQKLIPENILALRGCGQ